MSSESLWLSRISLGIYCANPVVLLTAVVTLPVGKLVITLAGLSFGMLGWLVFREMQRRNVPTLGRGLLCAGLFGFGGTILWSFVAALSIRLLGFIPGIGPGGLSQDPAALGIYLTGVFANAIVFPIAHSFFWNSRKEDRDRLARAAREKRETEARERAERQEREAVEREALAKLWREKREAEARERERLAILNSPQTFAGDQSQAPPDTLTRLIDSQPNPPAAAVPPGPPKSSTPTPVVPASPKTARAPWWTPQEDRWSTAFALLNAWIAFWNVVHGILLVINGHWISIHKPISYLTVVLPYPAALLKLIPQSALRESSRPIGIFDLVMAGMLAGIAWAFLKGRKWSWPAELLVCVLSFVWHLDNFLLFLQRLRTDYGYQSVELKTWLALESIALVVTTVCGIVAVFRVVRQFAPRLTAAGGRRKLPVAVASLGTFEPRRLPPLVAGFAIANAGSAVLSFMLLVQKLYPPAQDWIGWGMPRAIFSKVVGVFPVPAAINSLINSWWLVKAGPDSRYQNAITVEIYRDWRGAIIAAMMMALGVLLAYGLWVRKPWARLAAAATVFASVTSTIVLSIRLPNPTLEQFKPEVAKRLGMVETILQVSLQPNSSPLLPLLSIAFGLGMGAYLVRSSVATVFNDSRQPIVPRAIAVSDRRAKTVWITNIVLRFVLILEVTFVATAGWFLINIPEYRVAFIVAMLVPIVSIATSWKRPGRLAFGLSLGYFMAVFLTAGAWTLMWPLVMMLAFGGSTMLLMMGSAIGLSALTAAVGLVISVVGIVAMPRTPVEHAGGWSMGSIAPVAAAFIALWAGQMMKADSRMPGSHPRSYAQTKQMVEAQKLSRAERQLLRTYARCLFAFQDQDPGGEFPMKIDEVGPSGTSCLTAQQLSPIQEGFTIEYQTGESPRKIFRVVAAAPKTRTIRVDENGMFWTGESLEYRGGVYRLNRLRVCLEEVRNASGGMYPADLKQAADWQANPSSGSCLGTRDYEWTNGALTDSRYEYSYRPSADRQHLTLEARPATTYTEMRSYITDESGKIHWTARDRNATVEDPELPSCEVTDNCKGE